FLKYNFIPTLTDFTIENMRLNCEAEYAFGIFEYNNNYYDINIADETKNIDGLYVDSSIDIDLILKVLHDYKYPVKNADKISELELNKQLENHLKKYFVNVKKSGTSNKGLIDLIIGSDLNFGIELKLSKELKKSNQSDRAVGQVERYMEIFKNNFIVIIAGKKEDKQEKYVQDLIKNVKSKKGTCYFLEAS
ncbi:MAG: hypothetical protein ABIJ97_00540, partial [Bacteroidota bacterium]